MDHYISEALRVAERSSIRRFRTGAILVSGDTVSYGWSHTPAERMSMCRSMHAEHHAIRRCMPGRPRNSTIYIATLSRNGNVTSAKPCANCIRLLKKHGVERVVYTTSDGEVSTLYPNEYADHTLAKMASSLNVGRKAIYV